jgi:SPP1 family predicted phage head-tail adaptor
VTRPSIGDMRHRVILQQIVRTSDGGGGASESWSTVAELWAAIRPISGDERVVADAISGQLTHEVWVRHRAGVTPAMRFLFGSHILDIRAVIDAEGRGHRLKCLCQERDL